MYGGAAIYWRSFSLLVMYSRRMLFLFLNKIFSYFFLLVSAHLFFFFYQSVLSNILSTSFEFFTLLGFHRRIQQTYKKETDHIRVHQSTRKHTSLIIHPMSRSNSPEAASPPPVPAAEESGAQSIARMDGNTNEALATSSKAPSTASTSGAGAAAAAAAAPDPSSSAVAAPDPSSSAAAAGPPGVGPGGVGFQLRSTNTSSVDDAALCNLIVNYLPPMMDELGAYQLFVQFGPIYSVKIIYDKDSGESRGYGFIRYACFFSATYAIVNLNRYEICGKKLKVAYANLTGARAALQTIKEANGHNGNGGFTERQMTIFHEIYCQQVAAAQYSGQHPHIINGSSGAGGGGGGGGGAPVSGDEH
eukprot:gene3763-2654_t